MGMQQSLKLYAEKCRGWPLVQLQDEVDRLTDVMVKVVVPGCEYQTILAKKQLDMVFRVIRARSGEKGVPYKHIDKEERKTYSNMSW